MSSKRQQTRLALAARMHDCIAPAPMTFVADPEVKMLIAELLVRDLLALGWTPPQEDQ